MKGRTWLMVAVILGFGAVLFLLAFFLYTGFGRYAPPSLYRGVTADAAGAAPAEAAAEDKPTAETVPVPAPAAADAEEAVAVSAESIDTEPDGESVPVDPILADAEAGDDPLLERVDLRMKSGEWFEALELCRTLVDRHPKRVDVRNRLAAIWLLLGRVNESYRECRAALSVDPDNARAHLLLASVALRQGLPSMSVRHARKAFESEPTLAEARKIMARGLLAEGNLPDAAHLFEQLVRLFPNDLGVMLGLGRAQLGLGQGDDAERTFKKAAEVRPQAAAPYLALGDVYLRDLDFKQALASYREALKRAPGHPVALNNLASLIVQTDGDLEEARRLATQAWQLAPGSPAVADTLGWVHYQLKNYDRATVLLTFAARKAPANAEIRYHLGALFAARGMPEEAEKHLAAALAMKRVFPESDEARRLLQSVRAKTKQSTNHKAKPKEE